jgi:predicted nuclease with TOPRIM domain
MRRLARHSRRVEAGYGGDEGDPAVVAIQVCGGRRLLHVQSDAARRKFRLAKVFKRFFHAAVGEVQRVVVGEGGDVEAETPDVVERFRRRAKIAAAVVLRAVGLVVVKRRFQVEEAHVSF